MKTVLVVEITFDSYVVKATLAPSIANATAITAIANATAITEIAVIAVETILRVSSSTLAAASATSKETTDSMDKAAEIVLIEFLHS